MSFCQFSRYLDASFEMFKYLFMELRSYKKNGFLSQIYPKKVDHVLGAKRKA